MKLYCYRGAAPNFGDDLNNVLMPIVFPDFFDDDGRALFLGIGSVLFDHHPQDALKVVFGSGYGQYTAAPRLDESWKIYCVRGPLTASALGLDKRSVAADTAVLVNRYLMKPTSKRYRFSYIPHWQSLLTGDWAKACELAGVEFIDPRWPVERVIQMILSSETVVTEAMHGAIVADAFRVPWVPVLPFHRSHWFKWQDWSAALGLEIRHQHVHPASLRDWWASYTGRSGQWLSRDNKLMQTLVGGANRILPHIAARSLIRLIKSEPLLSADSALEGAIEKLEDAACQIRSDFRR